MQHRKPIKQFPWQHTPFFISIMSKASKDYKKTFVNIAKTQPMQFKLYSRSTDLVFG